jgi:hypothetical protein
MTKQFPPFGRGGSTAFLLLVTAVPVGCSDPTPDAPGPKRAQQVPPAVAAKLGNRGTVMFNVREVRPGVFCGLFSAGGEARLRAFVYVEGVAVKPGDTKDAGPHEGSKVANLPSDGVIPGKFVPITYREKYGC